MKQSHSKQLNLLHLYGTGIHFNGRWHASMAGKLKLQLPRVDKTQHVPQVSHSLFHLAETLEKSWQLQRTC